MSDFSKSYVLLLLNISLSLLLGSSVVFSQPKTLDRDLESVWLRGEDLLEFTAAPISTANNVLFLYAYRANEQKWQQIPFQFAEIGTTVIEDDTASGFLIPDDGLLDEDDVLVFMAVDAGDKANDSWIDNEASKAFSRYELEIRDSQDPSKKAWSYLYHSSTDTIPPNQVDYVKYISGPGSTPAADTIVGQTYKIAHAANGITNYLSFPPESGGTDMDILQKQEIRIKTSLGITLNETDNFKAKSVEVIDGNILVIRRIIFDIFLGALDLFTDQGVEMFFNGFSFDNPLNFVIPDLLPLNITINEIRQSFNLNENAIGMNFFSANNANVPVDGNPDTIDDSVFLFPEGVNRLLFTGPQGVFVSNFNVPPLGDIQQLFYKDNSNSGFYGNAGFILKGADIEGEAPLGLEMLFPGSINSGAESDFTNPAIFSLELESTPQTYGEVTSVETITDGSGVPESFALLQNFPNPFNPETSIRFSLPKHSYVKVTIYNLLGQKIRQLVTQRYAAGEHVVKWDGRDGFRANVNSGIYLYKIKAGDFTAIRKMILVK